MISMKKRAVAAAALAVAVGLPLAGNAVAGPHDVPDPDGGVARKIRPSDKGIRLIEADLELQRAGRISERARAFDGPPQDFPHAIRAGMPLTARNAPP